MCFEACLASIWELRRFSAGLQHRMCSRSSIRSILLRSPRLLARALELHFDYLVLHGDGAVGETRRSFAFHLNNYGADDYWTAVVWNCGTQGILQGFQCRKLELRFRWRARRNCGRLIIPSSPCITYQRRDVDHLHTGARYPNRTSQGICSPEWLCFGYLLL